MHPIRYCRTLAGTALCLFALSSGAATETSSRLPVDGAFMYLTPEDVRLVSETTDKLLESGRTGSSVPWWNKQSGNFGKVTLERSFRDRGVPCKQVNQVIKYSHVSDVRLFKLTFCRIDGEWKLAE